LLPKPNLRTALICPVLAEYLEPGMLAGDRTLSFLTPSLHQLSGHWCRSVATFRANGLPTRLVPPGFRWPITSRHASPSRW